MVQWIKSSPDNCRAMAECEALCRQGITPAADEVRTFLYRFEDKQYASINPYKYEWGNDDDWDITLQVNLRAFLVRSVTKCGHTIWLDHRQWRFVNQTSVKRFACPDIDEAVESFKARKNRQIGIYQARIARAKDALRLVETKADAIAQLLAKPHK